MIVMGLQEEGYDVFFADNGRSALNMLQNPEFNAPDMPLAELHDQKNTPENIPLILAALATIRSESKQELATITTGNAKRILNIK